MKALALVVCLLAVCSFAAFSEGEAAKPVGPVHTPGDWAWRVDSVKDVPEVVDGIPGLTAVLRINPTEGRKLLQFSLSVADQTVPLAGKVRLDASYLQLIATDHGKKEGYVATAVSPGPLARAHAWAYRTSDTASGIDFDWNDLTGGNDLQVVFSVPADFQLTPTCTILMMRSTPIPENLKVE